MVILLIMLGMASFNIDLFTSNSFFTNIQKMNVFFDEDFILCGKTICGVVWKNVEKFYTIPRCIFEKKLLNLQTLI